MKDLCTQTRSVVSATFLCISMLHTQLFHFHCYQIFCCNEAWAKCHQIWMEICSTLGQRSGSATAACKGGSRWKCKRQPSSSLWATLKHHTKVTSHFQTCRTCRAPRSAHMQVAVTGVMRAAVYRILLVTSVEPEEWGAGWQVRGRAHESWWMNSVLSGVVPKPQRGMCNHEILSSRAETWDRLFRVYSSLQEIARIACLILKRGF